MAESGPRATMGIFCGQSALLVCDRKCNKAWGEDRPQEQLSDNEDDVVWLADDELGDAPDAGQPADGRHNRWCWRECERSSMSMPDEKTVAAHDWSRRVYNIGSPNVVDVTQAGMAVSDA